MPHQGTSLESAFATKSEVSCFKLKGEDYHFSHTGQRAECCIDGQSVTVEYTLLGVLDGHGGKKAAEFSSKQVPIVLSSLIHERLPSVVQKNGMEAYLKLSHVTEERQRAWALQDAVVEVMPAALRDTFIQVNDEFLKKDVDSGTTATVVAVCGSQVITANVGDSLAFADLGTRVQQLTSSHRIDENTSEQRRIEASGGELGQAALDGKPVGPLRVWPGGLAFSRSLGDRQAGSRVLAEPEVSQLFLDERGARIILASDGLWDVLTGKSAAHRIRTVACSKAAGRLKSIAKDQRDRDDITVLVLDVLEDSNARIPAAIASPAELRRGNAVSPGAACTHQLWHPLTCPDHRSKEQWTRVMNSRSPPDTEMAQLSDPDSATVEEDTVSEQTTVPAFLYEEVRSITSLHAVHENEQEWQIVPSGHSSARQNRQNRQQQLRPDATTNSGNLPSSNASTEFGPEDKLPKNSQGGRGRGRGKGRGKGRYSSAGRGRGRGRGNMGSSDVDAAAGQSSNSTPRMEVGEPSIHPAGTPSASANTDSRKAGANGPGRRRNTGRGRHQRRWSGPNRHADDAMVDKRVPVQELFAAV